MKKAAELLTIEDIKRFPVWSFLNDDTLGETFVGPVNSLPVMDLYGKLAGTEVEFANGTKHWAILSNVDSKDKRQTQHFLTLTIFFDSKPFHLARYHDSDYAEYGPASLCSAANMQLKDIFPISYDLTAISHGDPVALRGKIEAEPKEKLSSAELIELSVQ